MFNSTWLGNKKNVGREWQIESDFAYVVMFKVAYKGKLQES